MGDRMPKADQLEMESSFYIQYEKKKMKECAYTLHNLASTFQIEEKETEEKDRHQLFLKKRLKENRILIADHLKEVAEIIEKAVEEKISFVRFSEKKEKQLAKLLLFEGIILEDISLIEKGNGRKEALVRLLQKKLPGKRNYYTVEDIGEFLSVYLGKRWIPAVNSPFFLTGEPQNFSFVEEIEYTVLTGYAKITKEGEKISGDNYAFFESSEKKFYGVLSDGMGSGEKANEDSGVVLEIAERFLEGGFTTNLTAKMINDLLLARGDGKNMSTLDICEIDLYTAKAEFLKVGATYSFIKRDGYVEKIPSISLPLGVFHELEMNQHTKQLLDKDYIFMFSDGILDHFPGEEGEKLLQEMIASIPYKRPHEMAAHLMKLAISASGGSIKDDTTILVMGIWENKV